MMHEKLWKYLSKLKEDIKADKEQAIKNGGDSIYSRRDKTMSFQ